MSFKDKIAQAEAESAKISWGSLAADKMRDITNDIRTDVVEATKEELHNGLNDIRHKLVEESWYGEQTTDNVNYTKSSDLYGQTAESETSQAETTDYSNISNQDLYGENPNQNTPPEAEQEQEID